MAAAPAAVYARILGASDKERPHQNQVIEPTGIFLFF